jgi:cytochrome c-type biogenesis protein CcmF
MPDSYSGEQLIYGQFGHSMVILACVTAFIGALSFFMRVRTSGETQQRWHQISITLFSFHLVAVVGIFADLLLMLFNHRFEYQYVWQHSRRDMNMNYILACLWEGQEGSTLLWMLWHAFIGLFLVRRAGQWQAPVMGTLLLVQGFLSVMLLGLYFNLFGTEFHIGLNPFLLIREQPENLGLPWTESADYLTKFPMFRDGRGLNPLLQNYWMTIHPPTLFLGFALTTVPFAYAVAGLVTGRLYDWQKPALTWAFIGVGVLGTGILMGGAWAYESLSFGGFWAWDPVENASLVPWLILVGAAHVMLIYRIKGQSLFTTFFLCILTFLLIVYSTFLTKSGILGETSVHAFTDNGLNEELTAFMGFFLWFGVMLLAHGKKLRIGYTLFTLGMLFLFMNGSHGLSMLLLLLGSLVTLIWGYIKFFPKAEKEEELWSREFWMFIGAMVLVISAFHIIVFTSLPVTNKFLQVDGVHKLMQGLNNLIDAKWTRSLVNANLAPDKNIIGFYNKWQIPIAFVVTLLMAVTQFFKYRKTDFATFCKQLRRSFYISLAISLPLAFFIYILEMKNVQEDRARIYLLCSLLLFGTVFSIVANADYWLRILKGKIKNAGSSIAHIGFAVLLLGALISTSKKQTISENTSSFDVMQLDSSASNEQNIFIRLGDTLPMGEYMITYTGRDRKIENGAPYVYFNVDYLTKDASGKIEKAFTLRPFIQMNDRMGNAAEPDTRHYLHKDIYTFIKFVPMTALQEKPQTTDGYEQPRKFTMMRTDTIATGQCIAILDSLTLASPTDSAYVENAETVILHFTGFGQTMKSVQLKTSMTIPRDGQQVSMKEAINEEIGLRLTVWKIDPKTGKIDVYVSEKNSNRGDFIVMEASIFPAINVLWLGCLIMIIGTVLAVRERMRRNKVENAEVVTREETK